LAQFPYDEFSKNLLEMALGSIGQVEAAKTVASEIREIDLYFVPHNPSPATPALGLLERLAVTATSFEPFRNPVAPEHVKSCLAKLLDLHGEMTKAAKREKRPSIPEQHLPFLWIVTPTLSAQKLQNLRAEANLEICSKGIYLMAPSLRTGIVVVHQLPETPDTLWLRIMGRNGIQARAAQEIAALPLGSPYRGEALQLLANLKIQLEAKTKKSSKDRKLIMNLSPLYLEKISEAEQRGQQIGQQLGQQIGEQRGQQVGVQLGRAELVVSLLSYRFGDLAPALTQRVANLTIEQLDALGKALLDFREATEIVAWLEQHGADL
jgi:hypothetical protein